MTTISYELIWNNWWHNADLLSRQEMIIQLLDNNWLANLSAKEQAVVLEYAPDDIKQRLVNWRIVKPPAFAKLGCFPRS